MIFKDRFEVKKNILASCIFIGAQLSINGIDQGEITAVPDEEISENAEYTFSNSGVWWGYLTHWECGANADGNFVRLSGSVDWLPPISTGYFSLVSDDAKDVCGNDVKGKAIICP